MAAFNYRAGLYKSGLRLSHDEEGGNESGGNARYRESNFGLPIAVLRYNCSGLRWMCIQLIWGKLMC